MRVSATKRLNIGISRILKGSSEGVCGSTKSFNSISAPVIKVSVLVPVLFSVLVFLTNILNFNFFSLSLSNENREPDNSFKKYNLTSFFGKTFEQDNALYNELFYAEPPSSFDLIEDMLTAQDQLLKKERQGQKLSMAKKEIFKDSAVNVSTLNKNSKETIDLSGPSEPQVIYDAILYPQIAQTTERNPFDTEAPDTFF